MSFILLDVDSIGGDTLPAPALVPVGDQSISSREVPEGRKHVR